jgi:acetoin utilization deacetylase AcuC-like enzyme
MNMKIVFHEKFYDSTYVDNGASVPGRMEAIMKELSNQYDIIKPLGSPQETIELAHSQAHIKKVKENKKLFDMASLAVGAAINAAEICMRGDAAFAVIRPPGHHASKDQSWGYCEFCNIAIALLKLKSGGKIKNAFILDFDAHTGDGTKNVLSGWEQAKILNPMAETSKDYLQIIEDYIARIDYVDVIAISAGFDTYIKDLGKKLKTFDFYLIGRLMKKMAKKMGHNRCFAVLEGGYYLPDLGKNVLAFCQGLE